MTDAVNLSKNGLKADSMECPRGGPHQVQDTEVIVAAKQRGGLTTCVKCGQTITLSAA